MTTITTNLDACAVCGTRHCHRCGTDLTDGMGVMRWAPNGLAGVHRIPGLLCVDCHFEIRAGDPDTGPACPSVYTVTVHSGRDTFTARATAGPAALIPADSADTGPTQVDALHSLLATWQADVIQWTMDHEHELSAVCPHGRTAAERTVTPCTTKLAGCVIV